ncbi:unnamed protein product, partial [Mesorhabditis belari]|uniref:Uncharacterized protein n=1 Tax=Mesorhabditis belari TaxID=2138241 RepID=A0AAF3F654_9BILA
MKSILLFFTISLISTTFSYPTYQEKWEIPDFTGASDCLVDESCGRLGRCCWNTCQRIEKPECGPNATRMFGKK